MPDMSDLFLEDCWADPLSRKERRTVADLLARACERFFEAREGGLWIEMADLHLDVTERAAASARRGG